MNIYDYEQEFYKDLEHGESRLNGIKYALNSALEKQDIKNALELYYEFIHEDTFNCDRYQSVIMFPEYLALFEKHPEYQKMTRRDMMWSYKYIIGALYDFYQIPIEQIKNIFKQYEQFCNKFRYDKRTYYEQLWQFFYECGFVEGLGVDSIEDCYNKSLSCKKDGLSDCKACELDTVIQYILLIEKDIDKALKKVQPIFSGELFCGEIPDITYGKFANYYFENADITNAKAYADKSYRLIDKDNGDTSNLMFYKTLCMKIFAYTDISKALKVFKKIIKFIPSAKSGNTCFDFFMCAYHLMMQLENKGHKTIKFIFPFKSEAIYNEEGIYSVSELKEFMYSKAKFYADKFDQRNKNNIYNEKLEKTYSFDYSKYTPDNTLQISLLDYIREAIDENTLPCDFSLPKENHKNDDKQLRFADGALDGILLFHTRPQYEEADEIIEILRQLPNDSVKKSALKIEKYFEDNDIKMLSLIDSLQHHIMDNTEEFDGESIYRLAIELLTKSKNREVVKCALSIFELFTYFNDSLQKVIKDIALCDEFTLYAVWVIRNWDNGNNIIFDLAKNTRGWGRIHAVEALNPDTDEIKDWLINYGYKNEILCEYSALTCFIKADIPDLLDKGITQNQLTPIGNIIKYLLNEGPVAGISEVQDPDILFIDYLNCAECLERSTEDNKNILAIKEFTHNENIKAKCDELLNL